MVRFNQTAFGPASHTPGAWRATLVYFCKRRAGSGHAHAWSVQAVPRLLARVHRRLGRQLVSGAPLVGTGRRITFRKDAKRCEESNLGILVTSNCSASFSRSPDPTEIYFSRSVLLSCTVGCPSGGIFTYLLTCVLVHETHRRFTATGILFSHSITLHALTPAVGVALRVALPAPIAHCSLLPALACERWRPLV